MRLRLFGLLVAVAVFPTSATAPPVVVVSPRRRAGLRNHPLPTGPASTPTPGPRGPPARAVPDARPQPAVLGQYSRRTARLRPAGRVHRLAAGVAVLPRPGDPAPGARHLR